MRSVRAILANARRYPGSFVLHLLCAVASVFVAAALVLLIGYILATGIPHLKPSLFAMDYNSENVSLLPALFNTVIMTLLSLALAVLNRQETIRAVRGRQGDEVRVLLSAKKETKTP